MKVLFLAPPRLQEGTLTAYTFVDEEIAALAQAGVQPILLSTTFEEDFEQRGIQVRVVRGEHSAGSRMGTLGFLLRRMRRIPPRWLLNFGHCFHTARVERFAADLVRREGIDLIHSHFGWLNGFGGMLAAAATGRPLVASLRGMDLEVRKEIGYGLRLSPFYDAAVRRLLRCAERTLYASDHMRELGIRLGAPHDRARTIRKGVDLEHFNSAVPHSSLRTELGLPDGPVILFVGGLIQRKGAHVLLPALARLQGEHAFSLVLCGEGPERAALQESARELGLAERVHFAGQIPRARMPAFFNACDMLVLPSLAEAAGNVILEAMASTRPVVTTASGGPPEYVDEGVTGFAVPPGDATALADKLGKLLADPALAQRMGRAGRKKVEREHGYDRFMRDLIAVYETLA